MPPAELNEARDADHPRRALIMAGGGLKVAFQAGVLQVWLDEARTPEGEPFEFEIADGASGGTFNLAMWCQGLSGRQIADNWRRTQPFRGVSFNWRQWLPIPVSIFTYDGFRHSVLRGTWALKWETIKKTGRTASFNMFDFDAQRHEVWPAARMDEHALISAVTLPMWFPPVRLPGERRPANFIDAVFATNANLEAAIDNGADELWIIWTESQRGLVRPGFVHQYFQMIEALSNSRVRDVVRRIRTSNDAIAANGVGEFDRHIELRWLSAEVPAHYLFSLSRASMIEAVERGVAEGRRWCEKHKITVENEDAPASGGEVTFREHMSGAFSFGAGDPAEGATDGAQTDTAIKLELSVEFSDIDRLIAEPEHLGQLKGAIHCEAFGGRQRVTDGVIGLLWDNGDPTRKRLSYRLHFTDHHVGDVTIFGLKYVVNGESADLWSDTTTLFIHLFRGRFERADEARLADVIGCGTVRISVVSFLRQLTSIRSTAGRESGPVRSLVDFGQFFLRQLWQVYGQPPGPEVLPRYEPPESPERRPGPREA